MFIYIIDRSLTIRSYKLIRETSCYYWVNAIEFRTKIFYRSAEPRLYHKVTKRQVPLKIDKRNNVFSTLNDAKKNLEHILSRKINTIEKKLNNLQLKRDVCIDGGERDLKALRVLKRGYI